MVDPACLAVQALQAAPAGAARQPVLEQLDPPRRAIVVMALLGIVLVGILLVAIVMIGAHWVRRLARGQPTSSVSTSANRRLRQALEPILPQGKSSETRISDSSTDDTVADR